MNAQAMAYQKMQMDAEARRLQDQYAAEANGGSVLNKLFPPGMKPPPPDNHQFAPGPDMPAPGQMGGMQPSQSMAPPQQTPAPGQASQPMQPPGGGQLTGQMPQGTPVPQQMQGRPAPGFKGDPQALIQQISRDPKIPPADKQAMIAQISKQQGGQGVAPYNTVAGAMQPPGGMQSAQSMTPPQPQGQPQQQGGVLNKAVSALRESGVPQEQWMNQLKGIMPYLSFEEKSQVMDMRQKLLDEKEQRLWMQGNRGLDIRDKVADTGAAKVPILQQGVDARTKTAEATAVRAQKYMTGGANAVPVGPLDKDVVDYYAEQSLSGDNSWQVGLARGKSGQQLISAVKDRIPKMASEKGMNPQDAMVNKAQVGGLSAAIKDRQKYVATGNQFVKNMDAQASLVEKYLQPGTAGGIPALNKWIQSGRVALAGDPDVVAFDTALRGLAREHQRIVTGVTSNAQLHVAAQQTADELLNRAQTPEQIRSVLKVMREEAQNAISSGTSEVSDLKKQMAGVGRPTTSAAAPFSDADKEARYQAWKAKNAGQ